MATPQELQQVIREMHSGMRRLAQEHQSALKSVIDESKQSDRGSRREKNSNPGARRATDEFKELTKSLRAMRRGVTSSTTLMNSFVKSMRSASRVLNNSKTNTNNSRGSKSSGDVSQLASEIRDLIKELRNQQDGASDNTDNSNGNAGTSSSNPTMRKWAQDVVGQAISKFSIMAGLTKGYQDIQSTASRGGVYSPIDTNVQAITMGLDSSELIEMQAQFRTSTLRATSGIDQWTEEVKKAQFGLLPYTGSLKEAAKVTATLQHNLMNVGFSFDQANNIIGDTQSGLVNNLKKLSAVTGDTILELSNRLNALAASDDNREVLRKMSKEQRADYMQTQSALLTQYTELTGNVDRASEILQRQIAGTNKSAKDRYVQSAKTAQAARMSGMSDADAQELQQLMAMNQNVLLQDAEKTARLRELGGQFNQNIKQMEGSASFATEHLGNVLATLGDAASMTSFNVETDTGLLSTNVNQQMERSIGASIEGNGILHESFNVLQQIEAGLKNVLTLLAVGSVASIVGLKGKFSTGAAVETAGAAASQGKFGAALGSVKTSLSNFFRSPKFIKGLAGGVAGGATLAAGFAVDKLWDPTSSSNERAKNATSSALEYAGIGMLMGTAAGPIGTAVGAAVGAAVGGLAGAIVGLNKAVTEQALYDADDSRNKIDANITLMKSRHQMEVDRIQTQIDLETSKMNQVEGMEREIHQQRVNQLNSQLDKENELYAIKFKDADNLRQATDVLLGKLQEKNDLRAGFDEGFGRNWGVGFKEFDPSDFMNKSKWKATDLIQSISDTMADQISESDFSKLQEAILNDEDISDKNLLTILETWRTRVSAKYQDEAQKAQDEQLKMFKTAKKSANNTTAIDKNGNAVVVNDTTGDVLQSASVINGTSDDLGNISLTDIRNDNERKKQKSQRTRLQMRQAERLILANDTNTSLSNQWSMQNFPTGDIGSRTQPIGLLDYVNNMSKNNNNPSGSMLLDNQTGQNIIESTQPVWIDSFMASMSGTTEAVKQLEKTVIEQQREQSQQRERSNANRSFEGNVVNSRGRPMQSKAVNLSN